MVSNGNCIIIAVKSRSIKSPISFDENTSFIPVHFLHEGEKTILCRQLLEPLGVKFDQAFFDKVKNYYLKHEVISCILIKLSNAEEVDAFDHTSDPRVDRILRLLRLYIGGRVDIVFSTKYYDKQSSSVSFESPSLDQIHRGEDFINQDFLKKAYSNYEDDKSIQRLARMANVAFNIDDYEYRIAYTFSFLESLSSASLNRYNIKIEQTRNRIRYFLGYYQDWQFPYLRAFGEDYYFDIIEIAGRLRDRLFHGSELNQEDLPEYLHQGFKCLRTAPLLVASAFRREAERGLVSEVTSSGIIEALENGTSPRTPWKLQEDERKSAWLLLASLSEENHISQSYISIEGKNTALSAKNFDISVKLA